MLGKREEVETNNTCEHYTVVGDALPEVREQREGRNWTEVERKGGNTKVTSIF